MDQSGIGITDMARRLGIGQATMSRYVSGEVEPSLDVIWALEQHLQLAPGDLLRAAGYVEDRMGVVRAITTDPALDERGRQALIAAYRELTKGRMKR